MARRSKDVTDAELAVLEALWEGGKTTVREIAETLYPQYSGSEHATVQKLLDRLNSKGYIDRDRSVWPHQYTAKIQREHLIGSRLQTMAARLCGGSLQPLLTHLVRNTKLSRQERDSLRSMLDELDQKKKSADEQKASGTKKRVRPKSP